MTDQTITTVVTAVVAALPPTLVAYAALRSSLANGTRAQVIADNSQNVANKVDEVHVLANSNLSVVREALHVSNEKIVGLEKIVALLMAEKDKAAAVAARPAPQVIVVPSANVPPAPLSHPSPVAYAAPAQISDHTSK